MHDNTIAPSKQTPVYDFKNVVPMLCVGSPANVANGTGDNAVYKYNLKNLPYNVRIIINDNTVMNNPPIKVTAHNGIDSKKPQLSLLLLFQLVIQF